MPPRATSTSSSACCRRRAANGVTRCGPNSATIESSGRAPSLRARLHPGRTLPDARGARDRAPPGRARRGRSGARRGDRADPHDRADRPRAGFARGTRLAGSAARGRSVPLPPAAQREPCAPAASHSRDRSCSSMAVERRDSRASAARPRRHGRHASADIPRSSDARRHRAGQSPRRRGAGLRVGCRSRLGGGRIRSPPVRSTRRAAGRSASGPRNLARGGHVRGAGARRLHGVQANPVGDQAVATALCAGMFAALVAALAGLAAVAFFPGQIPHLAGEIMMPGTSASARAAEDAIAASDRYAGLLVFGALLAASLWAMARPPGRALDDRRTAGTARPPADRPRSVRPGTSRGSRRSPPPPCW